MKILLQRVTRARVTVAEVRVGEIGAGLVVFVGVEPADDVATARRLADRTLDYRIFADARLPMNRSVVDVRGDVLAVSQFTLAADTHNGRRPGFSTAAAPHVAEPLFDAFCEALTARHAPVARGRFGADMQVELVNDGPVTFLLESR